MRRGSLVGPLILIVTGVVFLLKNIRPDLPLFDLFMTYWPILLIVWGGLRLVEILVTFFRGMKLPACGVSGGEWALIVILTVIGMSVWSVKRWTHEWPGRIRVGGVEVFGESYDYTEQPAAVKAAQNGRLIVDNARGNTRITGVEGDQVTVLGRKTVRALDRPAADKADQATRLKVSRNGDVVVVENKTDEINGARVSLDLEIQAPKGTTVEVRGRYGDMEVSDINGEVKVNSDNAGVRLQGIGSRVRVDLRRSDIIRAVNVKGDVEIKGRGRDIELTDILGQVTVNGAYSGETVMRRVAKGVRFESPRTEIRAGAVPGELHLTLSTLTASRVAGPVFVRAETKDVQLADVSETITLDLERGDVEVRQARLPLGRIEIKTRSGDIELALPPQAKFAINAFTERGEATNDFDPRLKVAQDNRRATITGGLGGGPELRLETQRGGLTLRKLSPAELTSLEGEVRAPRAPAPPEPPKALNQ